MTTIKLQALGCNSVALPCVLYVMEGLAIELGQIIVIEEEQTK